MTEVKEGMRRLLKEQGLTDEEIEKKLCTPTNSRSGSTILLKKKQK
jgi:hypothetical protein